MVVVVGSLPPPPRLLHPLQLCTTFRATSLASPHPPQALRLPTADKHQPLDTPSPPRSDL